ncbi:putative LPS assembly protein LptD [Lutibacter holmesii]|uniref:LPS assembly protein LptD n=1 Tax=Lutibacter holmesii TaxID=1137985 RepID=A0ABW3WRQ8_9FLAO
MLLVVAVFGINLGLYSQEIKQSSSIEIPASKIDTTNVFTKDTIANPKIDSLDVVAKDSIVKPKETLESIINHSADSLIRQDIKNNKILLYDNAHVHYGDIDLVAGFIEIDNNTNIVTAKGIKDSIGEYTQLPIFTQGAESTTQDSIIFNFKTEKAKIFGLRTEQEGVIIKGAVTKKENDSVIYVRDIRFTTSDKTNPDYYIKTDKAKIVPDKKIVIGFSNLVIKDVPTPLFLPFAYIPLTEGRSSGFLMPTWGENNEQGFFLQNGGYYFAINDHVDLAVLADIYTNGSWGIRTESSYVFKYKFSGNFSFRYEYLINGLRGFDDYSKSTNYNISWSHSQDSKSSPNTRFSASVNLGSSKYYKESLNEYNNNSFLNNTLSSSISLYKKLVGTPFSISASATHSQNTNTEVISMSLPSLLVNMDRIYPFAPKVGGKSNAFTKLGLTYSLKSDVRFNTTDEYFFKKEMFDSANPGVQQNASVNTNLKLLKYFTVSPNANYKEVWYFDRINKTYDQTEDTVVTDTIQGFNSFREVSAGASLSTTVYGMFKFKKGNVEAIRHVMRPSVSYSYRPDFEFWEEVQQSDDPEDFLDYSPFANGIYGNPGRGISNSLSFSLANTLEAKVKSKDSTQTEARKVTLLNNLNFSTSYNMASDSMRWTPVRMSAGTYLFNKKMQVNLNATLDPYALSINGTRINTANIKNGGSLFRLTNAGLTMNYSFSSKDTKGKDNKREQNAIDNNSDGIFGERLNVSNDRRDNDNQTETKVAKLYSARFPWTLKVAYAINYSNSNRQNEISSNSIMFSGDVELTPKWDVGVSSGYDFEGGGFSYTQLRFARDLDSWKMSFNWVPFGDRQTYYFFIGIKSSMLSDLKYDQRQLPDKVLF